MIKDVRMYRYMLTFLKNVSMYLSKLQLSKILFSLQNIKSTFSDNKVCNIERQKELFCHVLQFPETGHSHSNSNFEFKLILIWIQFNFDLNIILIVECSWSHISVSSVLVLILPKILSDRHLWNTCHRRVLSWRISVN